MRKLNSKQLAVIGVSLLVAAVLNWLLWLVLMRHPSEISVVFHVLTTICLAAAFVHIGDSITKAGIFR